MASLRFHNITSAYSSDTINRLSKSSLRIVIILFVFYLIKGITNILSGNILVIIATIIFIILVTFIFFCGIRGIKKRNPILCCSIGCLDMYYYFSILQLILSIIFLLLEILSYFIDETLSVDNDDESEINLSFLRYITTLI